VYFDGHGSHFDVETLRFFLKNHVYPRILKSNESINDQPLDKGFNSKIKAAYNERYNKWRITHIGEKVTKATFNKLPYLLQNPEYIGLKAPLPVDQPGSDT
jgi:hypothetical protein